MRLNHHLEDASLREIFQSAYKKGHSTETALTRIRNNILRAIDDGECVILILLDLSAASDAVDHDILITRLEHRFGITGKALGCKDTVLSIQEEPVHKDRNRALIELESQGSVLGPILYSVYTSPLTDIISKHNTNHHFYADDSQIYLSFKPSAAGEPSTSKLRIEFQPIS